MGGLPLVEPSWHLFSVALVSLATRRLAGFPWGRDVLFAVLASTHAGRALCFADKNTGTGTWCGRAALDFSHAADALSHT